jgi:hypothetical protein
LAKPSIDHKVLIVNGIGKLGPHLGSVAPTYHAFVIKSAVMLSPA